MKTIIANITSYIGISADAVHYYCRYKESSQIELCDHLYGTYDIISGATINGTDLLRKMTLDEAKKLTESPFEILDMVKRGTIRFDSVHQITEELRRQFPENNLIITMHDSIKEYVSSMLHEEYYRLFDALTKDQQETIIHHFVGNNYDRYNDHSKRKAFVCYVFRNKKEQEFVHKVKQLNEQENSL